MCSFELFYLTICTPKENKMDAICFVFLDIYISMPFYKIIKIVIHLFFFQRILQSVCSSSGSKLVRVFFLLIYCLQQNVIYKHVSALLFQILFSIAVLQKIRNIKKSYYVLLKLFVSFIYTVL